MPRPTPDQPSRLTDPVRLALARQRSLAAQASTKAKRPRQRSPLRSAITSAASKMPSDRLDASPGK